MEIDLSFIADYRHKRQLKRYDKWHKGHTWFAWRPVHVGRDQWAWLECVTRSNSYVSVKNGPLGQTEYTRR